MDDDAVYVVLGAENQAKIHYAMPVKNMVYDALNYSAQVEEKRKSYRRTHQESDKERQHLRSDEFLSGFRKDDRLMPVITLVIYWGASKWTGPRSIHDMLSTKDKTLLSFVQDYRIHLIAPFHTADSDFEKFHTDLGKVLQFIKYSEDKKTLDCILHKGDRFRRLDYDSANLINVITGSALTLKKEEKVDMCKAIDDMRKETQEETLLETVRNVMRTMCVTAKEAMNIMLVPAEIQEKLLARL